MVENVWGIMISKSGSAIDVWMVHLLELRQMMLLPVAIGILPLIWIKRNRERGIDFRVT